MPQTSVPVILMVEARWAWHQRVQVLALRQQSVCRADVTFGCPGVKLDVVTLEHAKIIVEGPRHAKIATKVARSSILRTATPNSTFP